MTWQFYSSFLKSLFDPGAGTVDLKDDPVKLALVGAGYTFNRAHDFFDDVSAQEAAGTGYTAGGQTLTTRAVTTTLANAWTVSWSGATPYAAQRLVRPSAGNGFLYMCATAGTSGGSEPAWPTAVGATVADGSCLWTCVGGAVTQFTADNPSWAGATLTARGAVIYKSTGVAASSPLVGFLDFGANYSATNGTFSIAWPTDGVFYLPAP